MSLTVNKNNFNVDELITVTCSATGGVPGMDCRLSIEIVNKNRFFFRIIETDLNQSETQSTSNSEAVSFSWIDSLGRRYSASRKKDNVR